MGTSEDCNDCGEEIDVEGDGPRPSRNWGLSMNVDVDMDQDAWIEVNGRTRRVKKPKVITNALFSASP
jgi:hypothetical protein